MAGSATVRELGPIFCFWLIPGFLQADETVFVVVVDLLLYCVFSCDGDTLPWVSSSPAKRPVEAACHRTHPSPFSVNFCCKHCFFLFLCAVSGSHRWPDDRESVFLRARSQPREGLFVHLPRWHDAPLDVSRILGHQRLGAFVFSLSSISLFISQPMTTADRSRNRQNHASVLCLKYKVL